MADLENAARKADAVIQGLLEFTAYRQQEIEDHNLSQLLEQSLQAVATELGQRQIQVRLELDPQLPKVNVDARKIRHVLIKLMLGLADRLPTGAAPDSSDLPGHRRPETVVLPSAVTAPEPPPAACIELLHAAASPSALSADSSAPTLIRKEDLDLMVVKKVVELYGGIVETRPVEPGLTRTRILFRLEPPKAL